METKNYSYHNATYSKFQNITIEVSLKCPYCGLPTAFVNSALIPNSNAKIAPFSHRCPNCENVSYSFQITNDKEWKLGSFYPGYISDGIPEILVKHCPNFAHIYSQAQQAEQNGLTDLAGMGYRAAIEFLIKDYALAFELDTLDDIKKLRALGPTISHYFNNKRKNKELLTFNAAEVVSIIGNDFTHWNKETDCDLNVLKHYTDIVIKVIEMNFDMKFPAISRQSQ